MDFNLTDVQVQEIQLLNAKLVSTKNLAKEALAEGNTFLYDKLITELAKTQISYEKWFEARQVELGVSTRPDQRWNVDFQKKIIQLLD